MFGFLNSTVLFAAAAALIPLIIHLFSRRKVKIVEFSSLKHLKAMQRRQVRRLKIRQLLLLILRMLIIFLAVLAFARPTTESGSVGTHASISAVVIYDNSASMNRYVSDGNLFEIARTRADELIESFGEADEVCLIPLDPTTESRSSIEFSSAAVISEQLSEIEAGYGAADFDQALALAKQMIEQAGNLNHEIYVITDRQRFSLADEPKLEGIEAEFYMVGLPDEATDNVGVRSVDYGGQLILPGHPFEITATIRNYATEPSDDLIASLYLNNNRVAQSDFTVDANGETEIRFERTISRAGLHSGYVEISDDRFLTDNRYYFAFKIPAQFNVLIIGTSASADLMRLAMEPAAGLNQYWSVKKAAANELTGINFFDYDVVFLSGPPPMSASIVRRLQTFLNGGRAIFVAYDGSPEINRINSDWSAASGVTFDQAAPTDFSRAGFYALESVDAKHPVFSVFDFTDNKPPEIKFYSLPQVSLAEQCQTIMQFTGDRPALIENRVGRGRVLTMTGPIDPRYSDLAGHAFFVPFIARIAEYLAADLSSYDLHLSVGDRILRNVTLAGSIEMPFQLITPDSSEYLIPAVEQGGALTLDARPVDMPGIYQFKYLGREMDRFAVNVRPEESDLSEADFDEVARASGIDDYHLLETGAPIAASVAQFRYGRELWQIFLWIAVLFIILEMLLARPRKSEET